MNRRDVLKIGGMALVGVGVGGCATTRAARGSRRRFDLPPVIASWDRVIRTTVGLRPHRPAGFNLSADRLDAKTVIHNYGHGGAGHSLGWGTGQLAAELALAHGDRRAAVLGCGTVGLTAARQLQRRGFAVTIYAKSVPPETTSNMALAAFTPTSGLLSAEASPEWNAQFKRAVSIAYRELQLLAGLNHGVSWIDGYNVTEAPPQPQDRSPFSRSEGSALLPADVQLSAGRLIYGPGEHPFPGKYATQRKMIRIEPTSYLDALVRDFLTFGGRLVIRTFDAPRDLMTLDESLIINCTGLGSRALFGDETMIPVKGQLVVLVPQLEVDYSCRAMPRRDGIALGSTQERGVWTLEPNEAERARVMEACIKFYSAMRPPVPGTRLTRSEAPREMPAVESFFDLES
ncbi:MAG: FAD-dependent oxidoreductase [Acidobacteria bacterium]|nr:FAD-dependent oxidoreductase [Acidobacteriota bacterium]